MTLNVVSASGQIHTFVFTYVNNTYTARFGIFVFKLASVYRFDNLRFCRGSASLRQVSFTYLLIAVFWKTIQFSKGKLFRNSIHISLFLLKLSKCAALHFGMASFFRKLISNVNTQK